MAPRSSSNPCLRSASPSMIPIPVRYRPLQAAPTDFYETASMSNYSLTPNSQPDEPSEIRFSSPLVSRPNASDTMQRYERLLEKMRATDEQLKLLSQSWKNTSVPKVPVSTHDACETSNNRCCSGPADFPAAESDEQQGADLSCLPADMPPRPGDLQSARRLLLQRDQHLLEWSRVGRAGER